MSKPVGKKAKGGTAQAFTDAPVTTDPRFAKVHTDPRFLKPKRDDTKVIVDERFKGLFEDDKSKKKKTDKYGRKITKGKTDADQMKRFYRLEDEDLQPSKGHDDGEEQEKEDSDSEDDATAAPIDYARGEGDLESSSEEESSSESESDQDDSDSDSVSESEDDDVMIGPSSVIDREKRKRAAPVARFDQGASDDDDGLGSDIGEIDLDEDVDEAVYAQLDAQAERAIAEGGIEDASESDSDVAPSSSRKKGKGKEKVRRSSKSSKQKIPRGDDTHRLAAVNLDWDHVRAKDIFKVFSSIVSPTAAVSAADALQAHRRAASAPSSSSSRAKAPPAISQVRGKLLHVRVYPSDFGKERMAKEDLEGPPPEIFKGSSKNLNSDSEEEINAKTIIQVDEGGEFDEEALRKYQLDRLRYYYAVATFDSKETARHVYNEIDGTEMERTANVFDLRFVPDGMDFPDGEHGREAEFRDVATEDAANYKGVDFKTDALRHSRVKLTWDQDDPERSKLTRMVARGGLSKEQLRDDDFKAYLASDTESEPDEDQVAAKNGRDRLRALLNLDAGSDESGFGKKGKRSGGVFDDPTHDDDEQGEMQITFMPGLSEAAAKKASNGAKKAGGEDETTLEKYLRKQKEKKERRKAQRVDADEDGDKEQVEKVDGAIDSADAGFDDPFFNENVDMEAALAAEFGDAAPSNKKKPSKKVAKSSKITAADEDEDPAETARHRAQLKSIIGNTNDELTQDGRQHFDMKDILRVESGKDVKRAKLLKRLSKKKQREEEAFQERKGAPLVQDTFEVDAKDERFRALMDDHRFAIDPTHPGFAKTKAMEKIMQERRKRLDAIDADGQPIEKKQKGKRKGGDGEQAGDDELSALVEKLKRRNGANDGAEGPSKRRKRRSNN
ncbi:related to ESF1 - 18S rRNA factor, nucleolar protein involved in pre-rRNA processing [Melanopsichium pennsylvanicum]|uniref:Related to ESF1 - 18S rRNA factor, nucleolar protein involved in pre-rRNA processing n=2 Tax=Melanopsichium pennsylvanicum TaxID=63383 RepID=A0AAJ4XFM3_9BASI|nr:related to ESF1-18S rRNA factor, nucleolar protein involved in pre-rRNA processing [Melanopsichium pennsylvanicum 4]SNX81499.1 related to ESF1 - 18S rRNA factor, nucleolar protein involved in pre-rRNA processing [Melanopsichium pennsylvanicum]